MQAETLAVREAIRIETVTVVYMILEAGLALWAGIAAHSALLAAFGLDSVIELFSGAIVLWRLQVEAKGSDPGLRKLAELELASHHYCFVASLCLRPGDSC